MGTSVAGQLTLAETQFLGTQAQAMGSIGQAGAATGKFNFFAVIGCMKLHRAWRWTHVMALIAGTLFALSGCATGPVLVRHSFSFDGRYDHWANTIDLLEYAYGDKYRMVRNSLTDPSSPAFKGRTNIPPLANVNAAMPVGEFLQVKWRIKATGEVLEDRVDLRGRLPADMSNHGVTFVIDGRQLYVFVITPTPITVNLPKPPKKTWLSRHTLAYEIYPNNEMK